VSGPSLPEILRQLSCLAEIRGSSDAAALRIAVGLVDSLPIEGQATFTQNLRAGKPAPVQLAPAAEKVLRDVASQGAEAVLASGRLHIPTLIRGLLEASTLTHDQAVKLARDVGVVTLPDLRAALADGRVERLLPDRAEPLAAAASAIAEAHPQISLGRARDVLESVERLIATNCRDIAEITIAGPVRRFEPMCDELVLVARTPTPHAAVDAIASLPGVDRAVYRSGGRVVLEIQHVEVDIRLAEPDAYGTVLFAATGSSAHVRSIAARRPRPELCARETDVYSHAGLAWIPPELRHGSGEVEAAAAGQLPRLVERSDIRGDFHLHTVYSDGQDSVAMVVATAAALGYEYIAITDHSQHASASRTMNPEQLRRQRDEIERIRERHPQMTILHGAEVDILPDGRLDFDDTVLEQLDLVIASLHERAGQDGAALTRRCLRAIEHPLVTIISHPSNQLVGRRPGYPLDYDAIFEAAAANGTALEIDGAPSHLDLDGERARAAVAAGVTVTSDSDGHRARAMDRQMRFGVGTARRGWVEARHVLNTRPIAEVLGFIQAKRRRSA
jgi:DNA polymerase (family 10)